MVPAGTTNRSRALGEGIVERKLTEEQQRLPTRPRIRIVSRSNLQQWNELFLFVYMFSTEIALHTYSSVLWEQRRTSSTRDGSRLESRCTVQNSQCDSTATPSTTRKEKKRQKDDDRKPLFRRRRRCSRSVKRQKDDDREPFFCRRRRCSRSVTDPLRTSDELIDQKHLPDRGQWNA